MKWLLSIIILLLLLGAIGLHQAPASILPMALDELEARGLLQEGSPKLTLTETSGTVWQGRAQQGFVLIDGATLELGVVNWQLSAMSLLKRTPLLDLVTQAPTHQLKAQLSANQQSEITITGLEGKLPIAMLEPWLPMLVKGDIAFVVDHAVFTSEQMLALDGVLNFEYVDWLGGDYDMPLGSYMAQLSLDENHDVNIQLNDFGATLGVDGNIVINPQGSYHFNARLQLREGLAPEVAESLSWFGSKDPQGDILINRKGRL